MDITGKQTLESMSQAVWYNQWTLQKFKSFLSGDILEVGCGIGNFTKTLADYGNVFAIDINDEYISVVKKKEIKKVKAGVGDIEQGSYFFKDQKFDTVVCLNVLEHIRDDKKALGNIYRLLKTDGKLILLVPSHSSLYGKIDESIGHFRRYEKHSLIELLKSQGFEVVKCRRLNLLGGLGWLVAGKFLNNSIVSANKIWLFDLIAPVFLLVENFFEPPLGTSLLVIATK